LFLSRGIYLFDWIMLINELAQEAKAYLKDSQFYFRQEIVYLVIANCLFFQVS